MRTRRICAAVLAALVMCGTGCGDADGDGADGSAGPEGDPKRLCEIDAEFAEVPDISQLTPAEAEETNATIAALLDESVAVAPESIRDSVAAVREGRREFLAVIADAGFDMAAVDQERFDAAVDENFISGATAAAEARWQAWNLANC